MNESGQLDQELCLAMLRRFASCFDRDAATWLAAHDTVVGEVLICHLDQLTTAERLDVYSTLFGFFRQHYRHVLDVRLRVENDPKCRERLTRIEELHREALKESYSPVTDHQLIASSEKNLRHEDARVRYLGALAVWLLTKSPPKVVPTLLAIVKDRNGAARGEAVALLREMRPLDGDVIQALRAIANDTDDPVRIAALEAVRQ